MSLEGVAVIISVLAFFFSIFAAGIAHRESQRGNDLQERIVELEEGRERARLAAEAAAQFVPRFEYRQGHVLGRFIIRNNGPGHATSVRVSVDGTPIDKHPTFRDAPVEIKDLGVDIDFPVDVRKSAVRGRIHTVELWWINPLGEDQYQRTQVKGV